MSVVEYRGSDKVFMMAKNPWVCEGWNSDDDDTINNPQPGNPTVARIRQLRATIAHNPGDQSVYDFCTEEIRQLSATLPPGTQL